MPKLIIGLGNPGAKYRMTRHNVGYRVLDMIHNLHIMDFGRWSRDYDGEVADGMLAGQKVLLLKPQTFMNESGRSAAKATGFLKIEPADVILVFDDLDLPLGTIRVRPEGSSGGHKGAASVLQALGTEQVARVRLGIGGERAGRVPAEDYVLERFSAEEEPDLKVALERAVDAVETLLRDGPEAAMNKYN
jgi:PTH1 family peptidyl-tRNA hydrolase